VAREIKQHKNASTCTHSKNVQNGWLKLKFKTLFWNLLKIVNDTILYSMCLESRTCYVIVFQLLLVGVVAVQFPDWLLIVNHSIQLNLPFKSKE